MLSDMSDASTPDPQAASVSEETAERPKRRRGLWIWVAAAAVLAIGAAVAIPIAIANAEAAEKEAAELAAAQAERNRLATFGIALGECDLRPAIDVEILDYGEALSMQRVGKWDGPALDTLYCVLGELDAPSSLESKIGATRALDGAQVDDWPGYEIEWRYHPDDGATVLIEHDD